MADIIIDNTVTAFPSSNRFGPVWHNTDIGYIFYKDSGGNWVYSKTSDEGLTWNAPVTFQSDTGYGEFSIWYDKWTPGDSGTIIHVVMAKVSKMVYKSLDTEGDIIGSEIQIKSAAAHASGSVAITKAKGNNLYVVDCGSNSSTWTASFQRSTDLGATWSARSISGSNITQNSSSAKLVPGNTSDDNDCMMIYSRVSTKKVFAVEYDDSGNSWTSVELFTGGIGSTPDTAYNVSVNHLDGHALVASSEPVSGSVYEIRTWDIADIGTITEKSKAVTPGKTLIASVTMAVDNKNRDIYIFYQSGSPNRAVFYRKSSDGMATWGSEVAYSDSTYTALVMVSVPLSIGTEGGQIGSIFSLSASVSVLYNASNSIAIGTSGIELINLGTLSINSYEGYTDGSTINVVLGLQINEWRETIKTKAISVAAPDYQNTAISINFVEILIKLKGVCALQHAAHPVVTSQEHLADFIDIEEAALLWNRMMPKQYATLKHVLPSGTRTYKGVIQDLILIDNPGTEKQDFVLTFACAYNISAPAVREWN